MNRHVSVEKKLYQGKQIFCDSVKSEKAEIQKAILD